VVVRQESPQGRREAFPHLANIKLKMPKSEKEEERDTATLGCDRERTSAGGAFSCAPRAEKWGPDG